MDSLIVLRKPLRRSSLVEKLVLPKNIKKIGLQVEPVPAEPEKEPIVANYEPDISFVKLYKELCLKKSLGVGPEARRHCNTPRPNSATSRPSSATSLATRYRPRDLSAGDVCTSQLYADSWSPSSARAELMLEFDYGTSFDDS